MVIILLRHGGWLLILRLSLRLLILRLWLRILLSWLLIPSLRLWLRWVLRSIAPLRLPLRHISARLRLLTLTRLRDFQLEIRLPAVLRISPPSGDVLLLSVDDAVTLEMRAAVVRVVDVLVRVGEKGTLPLV